jgi:hypothetical protein
MHWNPSDRMHSHLIFCPQIKRERQKDFSKVTEGTKINLIPLNICQDKRGDVFSGLSFWPNVII